MGIMVKNFRVAVNWMPSSICSQWVNSLNLPWSLPLSHGVPLTRCKNMNINALWIRFVNVHTSGTDRNGIESRIKCNSAMQKIYVSHTPLAFSHWELGFTCPKVPPIIILRWTDIEMSGKVERSDWIGLRVWNGFEDKSKERMSVT